MKTKIFMSAYYLSLSMIVYRAHGDLFGDQLTIDRPYLWFASILNGIPFSFWFAAILSIATLCLCLYTAINPARIFRALTAFFCIMYFGVIYSSGKISHSNHTWLFSACILVLANEKETLNSYLNALSIRLSQTIILSHYFIAGLWKIRGFQEFNFSYIRLTALEHLSTATAEGYGPPAEVANLLLHDMPNLTGIGFIAILIFQVLTLLPIWTGRHLTIFAILAFAFHQINSVVLGIGFSSTIAAVLFFLLFAEQLRKTSLSNP